MGEITRYDVLILSELNDFTLTNAGTRSLIQYLSATNVGRPFDEAVATTWQEVYLKPGASAHTPFVTGATSTQDAPFLELVVRGGRNPVPMRYGIEGTFPFFMEFRGSLFKDPIGLFRSKLKDVLGCRIRVFYQEHQGLLPHETVPDDEKPTDMPKTAEGVGGRVGTRVEEF
ncbi:MAG: hypothetical protein HUU55_22940 [Myxococcales bacterium]|nr:hypothetical protein [Myxococcales bacterium]